MDCQNSNISPSIVENDFKSNSSTEPEQSKSFIKEIFAKGQKSFLTFIYCISFWNFGICVAIFGPTLLDLACQTSRY